MPLLKTVDGGKLLADADPRTIGPDNCSRRVNIRREDDAEVLMPGWESFGELPEGENCIHLFRAARPNGERTVLAFSSTAIYIYDGETATFSLLAGGFSESDYWEAENLDGYVVFNNGIDLPYTWDWEGTPEPIHELREQGVIRCGSMWTAYNFLLFGDVTEFSSEGLKDWMNGSDPYGNVTISDESVTRTHYRVIWSDKPRQWGLLIPAFIRGEGSSEIVLPYPVASLKAGDTINFIETVADEDNKTVQLTEAEIKSIEANRLTMVEALPTSSNGQLNRSNYAERIIGYDDLQGDGSPILKGGVIGNYIYITRETGIILGQITESVQAPFYFQEAYRGLSSPTTRKLIRSLDNSSLFYYSRRKWFEFSLQSQRPEELDAFELNESIMSSLDDKDSFAVDYTPRRELWIFLSDRTIVYDYANSLLGEVDSVFNAAALIDDPEDQIGGVDRIFILAKGNKIYQMRSGLFTREQNAYEGLLEYGWIGDTGSMRDTLLRRYIPQGTGGSVLLRIDKYRSGSEDPVELFPEGDIRLGLALQMVSRAQWFKETIKINSGTVRLIGREIEQQTAQNRVRGYAPA